MKKIYPKLFLLTLFCLSSCGPIMSPAIEFENSSPKGEVVKNVEVLWNGHRLLGDSKVGRCAMYEQSYFIKKESDFFGPVHIEWENASGKKLTKDFTFTKKDFPTFKRSGPHVYHYVVLYFTQTDVEYYTSDNPNIEKIRKEKAGDWSLADGKCVRECSQEYVAARPLSKPRCLNHENFKNSKNFPNHSE